MWEDLLAAFNKDAPKGINKVIETGGLDWCLIIMELRLVETMQNGLIISVAFALVALLVATQNVV